MCKTQPANETTPPHLTTPCKRYVNGTKHTNQPPHTTHPCNTPVYGSTLFWLALGFEARK